MRKILFTVSLVMLTSPLLLCSCGSDHDMNSLETLTISNLIVSDVGDMANASDINIAFTKVNNESDLIEYRVYILKSSTASEFDLDQAIVVSSPNYTTINKKGSSINTILPLDALDIDGNSIIEDLSYTIFIMSLVDLTNENFLSGLSSSVEITLTTPIPLNIVSNINQGFSASGGIAVGSDGSIYVADFGTGAENGTKILKFVPDGSSFTEFADGLLGPTGGSFNSKGDLFWSSYSAGKVHKIDVSGNVTDFAPVPGPVSIVIDANDDLYVASCDGNIIKKITSTGTVSTFATSSMFNCINGLTSDTDGNLYACNFEDGRIFKITSTGTVSVFANISSGSSVNITYKNGLLYVTGRNAHTIYTVSTINGNVENFAGTGSRGNSSGSALESQFSFPNGIRFSLDGNFIYINDVDPNSGTNNNGINFNPNILRVIEIVK